MQNTARRNLPGGKKNISNNVYCRSVEGTVYQRAYQCTSLSDRQISKAEFDQLKGEQSSPTVTGTDPPSRIAKPGRHPDLEPFDEAAYVTVTGTVVYDQPQTRSSKIAKIMAGTKIGVHGKIKNSNWYLISLNGVQLGYVLGFDIARTDAAPENNVIANAEAKLSPRAAPTNPDAVAVIIGNRDYEGSIPDVDYAHNDAGAVKKFVTHLLGYDPENVIDLRDATQAKLQATFGNERSHQGKLWSYLDAKGGSDVVIYYSGHGVPGLRDGRGYLLPTDADPDHPEINGYPLDTLYANLEKLEARSITILIDACFSGESHKGMLIRSASPILVTQKDIHKAPKRVVVLTAASGDQLASWDETAKHGLFTRYFLEAVYGAADADKDGAVSLDEVKTYLDDTMTRRARRDFLREQEAWVSGASDTVLVRLGDRE